MSEGQTLLLVLVLLYLSDCWLWVGRGAVLFTAPWCRGWRVALPNQLFGNARGGIALLNPLPPLGVVFVSHLCPVYFSATGLCGVQSPSRSGAGSPAQHVAIIHYQDISTLGTDGCHLVINGIRLARAGTEEHARTLAAFIDTLRREPVDQRAKSIRLFMGRGLAKEAAENALTLTRDLGAKVRSGCIAMLVMAYGVIPLLAMGIGLSRVLIPAAVALLAGAAWIAVTFSRAHKALHPDVSGERRAGMAKMILCPPVAIRAADLITLEAISHFHPVLIASLLPGASGDSFIGQFLRNLKHPLRSERVEPQATLVMAEHRELELELCCRFLERQGRIKSRQFFEPPIWDGVSLAFCPRCRSQLAILEGECPDCPGVARVPFPTSGRINAR